MPTLHFLCGKVAAGKTTLARHLATAHNAVLVCEDIWLDRLYPEEIMDFDCYLKYSARLKSVVGPHVEALLDHGISVVLDYPANTLRSRVWVREIFEAARADHVLHFVDTSNERCLAWAGVLGGTVDAEDDWHMVMVDGEPRVGVQLKANHLPPDWPDGTPPQQIHLDLWVDDFTAAHERVMSLGAKVLKPSEEVDTDDNFQVYADPAGHPFCLCWIQRREGRESLHHPSVPVET